MKFWKWWIVSDKDVQWIREQFWNLHNVKMAHIDSDCPYKDIIEQNPELIANTEWPIRHRKDLERQALRDVYDEELEIMR